jgi:subtilase family serine protease
LFLVYVYFFLMLPSWPVFYTVRMKNIIIIFLALMVSAVPYSSFASYKFGDFRATPPIHVYKGALSKPGGISPKEIKAAYNLPAFGGHGTIAIIGAYDAPLIEKDLATFDAQFGLASCTTANGCFEKHIIDKDTGTDPNWSMEMSLDVEWAHAIAPQAKILLIEAKTLSASNMLQAIDYAASRKDVVAISMSWGGKEFPEEVTLDQHFKSVSGAVFFASSGDNGSGVNWPAVSPNVVAVGGTTLTLKKDRTFLREIAWIGSGGGVSLYEKQSTHQKNFTIPRSNGMRAVPDVSYNADPKSGFPIYRSTSASNGSWYVVGGTSAAAPQWAAIHSLGLSATLANLYGDKSSAKTATYFRDIASGSNGSCSYFCDARKHYDYVTGLGSPLTIHF